jgi:hypothetical protein
MTLANDTQGLRSSTKKRTYIFGDIRKFRNYKVTDVLQTAKLLTTFVTGVKD